jgi:hypothetical protein
MPDRAARQNIRYSGVPFQPAQLQPAQLQPAQLQPAQLQPAQGAVTASPIAVMPASGSVITTDSLTVPPPTDKTEGGTRRFLPGRSAGVSAPQPQ